MRISEKSLFEYLIKFIGAFYLLFYGTEAINGLSSDNNCNTFVAGHLNFIVPLRYTLLFSAKAVLSLFHYSTYFRDEYTLALHGGGGVRMVYSCIGYGVMSFWASFIFANTGSWKRRTAWIAGGWAAMYVINVIRISLLLVATNKHWAIPFGSDHHTWFNLAAYALIFSMIYFYDRSGKKHRHQPTDLAPAT